jgi:hypothetical protein
MRLARDPDTCRALLLGEPVDPAQLDPAGLEWARRMRFVRLDVAPIALFADNLVALEEAA